MRNVFPSDATIAELADWLELDHLLSGRPTTSDAELVRANSIAGDDDEHEDERDDELGETIDGAIVDTDVEMWRDQVAEELRRRHEALGELYPFVAAPTIGGGWQLSTRARPRGHSGAAHVIYTAALLMSAFRLQFIARTDPETSSKLIQQIPELFQLISTFASMRIFGHATNVYWFGFPRPDRSGFEGALVDLVNCIGHGDLKDPAPYNTSTQKDATVDLVAWRPFADEAYGSVVLYGQVASGRNWTGKPIHSHINGKFFDRFINRPSSQYLGATFIPFVMHTNVSTPADGNYSRALVDNARQVSLDHGTIIDRLRIVELVGAHDVLRTQLRNAFDSDTKVVALIRWIRAARSYGAS